MTPRTAEAVFDKLFLTAEGCADPYPLYDQLRDTEPVHRSTLGMWVLSRYDNCWAAMRDPGLGKTTRRR
jgi:cytochrome P450